MNANSVIPSAIPWSRKINTPTSGSSNLRLSGYSLIWKVSQVQTQNEFAEDTHLKHNGSWLVEVNDRENDWFEYVHVHLVIYSFF